MKMTMLQIELRTRKWFVVLSSTINMAFTIANTNATMPDALGPRPRNVVYHLQRMAGYSKNTISIQPQTKPHYYPGDTLVCRLPTDSILDLHTLTLNFVGRMIIPAQTQLAYNASFHM